MKKFNKKIAITTGDVNGIGAEITIKALNNLNLASENIILISNKNVLDFYGKTNRDYEIIEVEFDKNNITPGKLTKESGEFSFQCLKKACELAKNDLIQGLITAPVSKEALHLANHKFNGQTEILEHFLAKEGQKAEMLFVANNFRVLLLTRHVALKEIKLDKNDIVEKIVRLNDFFKSKFNLKAPNFALCSFNPHAGENGILGREEIEILEPAVKELHKIGISITKPMPADTLFIKAAKDYFDPKTIRPKFDCYIACYHDQGLIPIKTVASDKTVNMTIGLEIIRTSPAHGTAFDIAGKNFAKSDSMESAILEHFNSI